MKQKLLFNKGTGILMLLIFYLFIGARAQTKISGKVSANDNLPLPGASIKIKGTPGGTVTDNDGSFVIIVQPTAILVVSSIGFITKEVKVNNQTVIQIALESDNNKLSEIVVTGYTSQRKKDLTGAVAIVNVAQLKAQPAASAVEALQGKAPGVQVINDGAPGSTPQIRVRGFSTINNNDPLYVIDGVPFEGKLSWLNQNDIESLQVLKDASSASIYGARANNGVLIITTKKGIAGPPKITVDAYAGIQTPRKSSFPEMMNPQQYAEYLFAGYRNAGLPVNTGTNYGNGTIPSLPDYLVAGPKTGQEIGAGDTDIRKYNYSRDPATFYQITRANKQGTNWFDAMSESAAIQNYQLSATGGSEDAVYTFTGGYLNQKGTLKHTGFSRYNFRANTQLSAFTKKVRFGENIQYSYSEGFGLGVNPNVAGDYQDEGSPIGWAYRIPTIIPVYDVMGNFAGSRGSQLGNAENPVAVLYRAKDNINRSNFLFGNVFAEADIINGLVARTNFGLRYENYNGMTLVYPNLEFSEGNTTNSLNERQGYTTEWTWTNTLAYKKLFNRHSLSLLAGSEAIRSRSRELNGGRNNFFILGNPDYFYLDPGTSNISNRSFGNIGSLYSLFGRADYAYNDRYLFSLTLRRDGSSNFGPENKYGYFPAASVAWRLSEEAFLKSINWIADLKLRAGYGETGNQRIPGFQYLNRFQSSLTNSAYPTNGGNSVITGVWQRAYNNRDVKWESLSSINIGADFSLFDGALDGSFDWYQRKTTDMLYPVPLPSSAVGLGESPFVNVGDMSNKGIELSLGYHYGQQSSKPLKFDIGLSFSRNINEITKLAPSISQQPYGSFRSLQTSILQTGQPFGSFYGYKVQGIYQSQSEIDNNASYTRARVGGFRYQDINGDGIISPADRTVIGNPHPDFIYSLSLNVSYKRFDIAAFFNGVQGNDLYEATRYFTDFSTFDGARSTRLLDSWSPNNTGSQIPSPYVGVSDLEYASSSYYVQNGSFLRMKNLQIGYSIPATKLFGANTGFTKLRVYVSTSNIFTITNYTGLDPEISQDTETFSALGVDRGIYPSPRQILLGINIGF